MGVFDRGMPQQSTPLPFSRKPSIVNRILQRLMPIDPMYAQFLSPEEQESLRGQGTQRLGLGLLKAFGPQPKGTSNVGTRIADAFASTNWDQVVQQHAQFADQMRQRQQKEAGQRALRKALARLPVGPGATGPQMVEQLSAIQNDLVSQGFLPEATQLTDIIKLHQGQNAPALSFHASKDGRTLIGLNAATGEEVSRTDLGAGPSGENELQSGNRKDFATRAARAQDQYNVVGDSYRALVDANGQKAGGIARDRAMIAALAHIINPQSGLTINTGPNEVGGHLGGLTGEVVGLVSKAFGPDSHELTPEERAGIMATAEAYARRARSDQERARGSWQQQIEAMIERGDLAPGAGDFILGGLEHWGGVTFSGQGRGGATAERGNQALPPNLRPR